MADLVLVAVLVVFIALCVAYVGWCDRIVSSDVVAPSQSIESQEPVSA